MQKCYQTYLPFGVCDFSYLFFSWHTANKEATRSRLMKAMVRL